MYGDWIRSAAIDMYNAAFEFALKKGIIIADTKFEMSTNQILADEVLTPDSSRLWPVKDWEKANAEEKSPSGYDKEPVRIWGKSVNTPFDLQGINKLRAENTDHIDFVHRLNVPSRVLENTTKRYREIFNLLTGMDLETFQKKVMHIRYFSFYHNLNPRSYF